MGFDQRFTIGLFAWIVALVAALLACVAAFLTPGLGAARIVALAIHQAVDAALQPRPHRRHRAHHAGLPGSADAGSAVGKSSSV